MYDVCQRYREQIPELRRIYFTHREPLPPQSEQVDRLIKILTMSREITLPNPRYPTIDMNDEKKKSIKERDAKRLARYSPGIQAISRILEAEVSVA